MYRLFIAIHLPPDLLRAVTELQEGLRRQLGRAPLRWVRPEGIHLTLKFLGDTAPGRASEIAAALQAAAAAQPRFTLSAGGLGCFPNWRAPNVLWVGVSDPDRALQRLAASVDSAAAALGWPPERRPFSGHLTLARVQKQAGGRERRLLGERLQSLNMGQHLGVLPVDAISLMRSELHREGAMYTQLAAVQLATPAEG